MSDFYSALRQAAFDRAERFPSVESAQRDAAYLIERGPWDD